MRGFIGTIIGTIQLILLLGLVLLVGYGLYKVGIIKGPVDQFITRYVYPAQCEQKIPRQFEATIYQGCGLQNLGYDIDVIKATGDYLGDGKCYIEIKIGNETLNKTFDMYSTKDYIFLTCDQVYRYLGIIQ